MNEIADFLKEKDFVETSPNKWADLTNGNPDSLRYKQKIKNNPKTYWMPGKPVHGAQPKNGTKFTSDQIESQEFLFWEEDKRSIQDQINLPPDLGKIKPHIQVWTGNKSIHNYLRIENTKDLPKWKQTQKLIISLADSDKTIHNYDRIMCHPGHINPDTKQTPLRRTFDHSIYTLDDIHNELKRVLVNKIFLEKLTNFPHGKHGSGTYEQQRYYVWQTIKWSEENNFDLSTTKRELGKLLEQNERGLSAIKDYDPDKIKISENEIIENEPIPTIKLEKSKDPNSIDLDYEILPPPINDALDVVLYTLRQSKMTRTALFLVSVASCMRYSVIDSGYDIKQPNSLWVGLVGESGSKKSPLLDKLFGDPTEDVKRDIETMKFDTPTKNDIKKLAGWSVFPPNPVHRIGAGSSMEGIFTYLQSSEKYPKNNDKLKSDVLKVNQQPLPTVLFADELSEFLGGTGRYNKSSENANIASLLELFNGHGKTNLRVDCSKTVNVDKCNFNIIGGIQPDVIKRLLKTVGVSSGLWGRFQFVPIRLDTIKGRIDSAPRGKMIIDKKEKLKDICNRAFNLKWHTYHLDDEAGKYILELTDLDLDNTAAPIERELRGKRASLIMRWALPIHIVDSLGNGLEVKNVISLDTVKKAEHLYEKIYEYNVLLHTNREATSDVKSELYFDFREWLLNQYPNGGVTNKEDLLNGFNKSRSSKENKFKSKHAMGYVYERLEKEGIAKAEKKQNRWKVIVAHTMETK